MKKILYIPLDERPCNYLYPQYIVNTVNDIELIAPPEHMLGNKKIPANIDLLWEFVLKQACDADAIVLSVDMLLYGGLVPSRLHHLEKEHVLQRLQQFKELKKYISINTPIYGFNLIMRTPQNSSSDEEPDYYKDFGSSIFRNAYLSDKKERNGITQEEEGELQNNTIPKEVLIDYESRRNFNREMNIRVLDLVKDNTINFLSIPQDDSAEYGYTAKDQQNIQSYILKERLQSKIMMYPGADETGSTLVARAYNSLLERQTKVYPFFSSIYGHLITPLYEDRPLGESVKAHLLAADCRWVSRPEDADFALAINTPGKTMQEAANQDHKDVTYTSFRNLLFFVDELNSHIQNSLPVSLADVAFANGGDMELIDHLDNKALLDQLISYKGWNTACNTLGTSIAAGVFGIDNTDMVTIKKNTLYHLLEDGFYQASIRSNVTKNTLPELGLNYFNLKKQTQSVKKEVTQQMHDLFTSCIKQSYQDLTVQDYGVYFPWNRMFEIGMNLKVLRK